MLANQQPQSFLSAYAPRLRQYGNALLTPIIPQLPVPGGPTARTTKRGTVAKNYAEDEYDDEDIFEDGETNRRLTGLRSRREDPAQAKELQIPTIGQEIYAPVDIQGIWRDWMGRLRLVKTDKQHHAQTNLPLTLIPIRLDLDISSFIPPAALPLPPNSLELGINPALPAYRSSEATPAYRLKDIFLWNLHETLVTPDQFAQILIADLDIPSSTKVLSEISTQIRSQLEEYAGVALHPLFHSTGAKPVHSPVKQILKGIDNPEAKVGVNDALLDPISQSSKPDTDIVGMQHDHTGVAATAVAEPLNISSTSAFDNEIDPDDTYRCIVTLNINLQNKLYTDKFEWSLLHPVGLAEQFSQQTCADLGLGGEWVTVMSHAIYEAVLRLKKEACESGGLVGLYGLDFDNMSANETGAGWRYDPEQLGDAWEPKLEYLSKEEIEKREGDRERQLRRLRRETARFSSTTNMTPSGMPEIRGSHGTSMITGSALTSNAALEEDTPMGRGERSKKKRRFRSLSPVARNNPEVGNSGYGGGGAGALSEWERATWRCAHCLVHGSAVWGVRDGPRGPRSLCMNCGLVYERDQRLPPAAQNLHYNDPAPHR